MLQEGERLIDRNEQAIRNHRNTAAAINARAGGASPSIDDEEDLRAIYDVDGTIKNF
jgi:hypothetical protein